MLTLCRRSSDEQLQKLHGSNLLRKLKHGIKCAEPYYPTKPRVDSDVDTTNLSETSSKNTEPGIFGDFQLNNFAKGAQTAELPQKTHQKSPNQKYKTELCKNFDLYGHCKWNDSCFFAHGKGDLKSKLLLGQFYKTKICKHFHRGGFCPYGSRCQYFHFKAFQMSQELLESVKDKLAPRALERETRLKDVLEAADRVQSRLEVFKRLHQGENAKSLQEKFLENDF